MQTYVCQQCKEKGVELAHRHKDADAGMGTGFTDQERCAVDNILCTRSIPNQGWRCRSLQSCRLYVRIIVLVRMIALIHLFDAVDVPKGCATGGRKYSGISGGMFSMSVCACGVCSDCAGASFGLREVT